MKARTLLAVALLLPVTLSAQGRRPRIGGIGRPQGPEVGRQPEVIKRAVAIQRSKYSFETYPILSRVSAPGFVGGRPVSSWTSFGTGTRVDYRLKQYLSATFDITSSYLGGPARTETAELGFRVRNPDAELKIRPFVDARLAFAHSSDSYSLNDQVIGIGPASSYSSGMRYSRGFGGVVGAGFDYALTNTFALTTAASVMRTSMQAYDYNFTSIPTSGDRFTMTTYRLTLGLKYNGARVVSLADEKSSAAPTMH